MSRTAAAGVPSPAPPAGRAARSGPAILAATIAVLLWGVSFPASRVAVREIPPLALATGRFLLATAVLWPAARRRGLVLRRADAPAILLLGLLGVTLYFAFENTGLVFTTASHASLIVATVPLGSAVVEAVRLRRPPRPLAVAGMIAAAVGVAVIVRPDGSSARSLWGDLLVLCAMACWVGYTFVARELMARTPALLLTAATMAAGAALLLPLAAIESVFAPLHLPSAAAWAALVYLGLLCSAAAYLLWNIALPALGVSVANNFLNGVPLVAVLTGVLALHEPWTASIGLGGALVLLGVIVVERSGR